MHGRCERASAGLTLAELLVVLVIIGVMASIAIPMLYAAGALTGDKLGVAAREYYALLRAARIYAAANTVGAGLAYWLAPAPDNLYERRTLPRAWDNVKAVDRRYMNAYFMVRRLRREENAALGLDEDAEYFVPVQGRNGNVQLMDDLMCIYTRDNDDPVTDYALKPVDVCDLQGDWPPPPERVTPERESEVRVYGFYAHVFRPSGELDTSSTKQRFQLAVGLLPEAQFSDRFLLDEERLEDGIDNDGNGLVDEPGEDLIERLVGIELFKSTGRVQITETAK
ncbi:MAG TPA: prepilin-type N-terminal cleavage/methylation domain-containing protein [Candidatus Hydrogenedentes bacterium]|nr:prepilin-type N-terminal cleavage/methylation domain-containing protein [Candidatus Hydrogenedentota bacterium]